LVLPGLFSNNLLFNLYFPLILLKIPFLAPDLTGAWNTYLFFLFLVKI